MRTNNLPKIFAIALVILVACGKEEGDKKAQLEALKKQQTEISDKVAKLEAELAASDTNKPVDKSKLVKVETVTLGTFNHYIEVQGKVDSDDNLTVTPETAGNITKLYVKRGDKVSRGKVLAEVDATLLRKGIDELKISLDLITTVFEKQEKLYKENIGTEVQYLEAKANKESVEGRMASLKEQLKKSRIVSPIEGYVDEIYKKEGEMLAPGTPAFRIIGSRDYKIVGEIAESYVGKISTGDEVVVRFPDVNKEIKAKISVVGSSISELNRTLLVEIKLPNLGQDIKPNMIAYLRIKDFSKSKAIVIPINTVQKSATGNFVFVVSDKNTTERRVVTLANTYGSEALISEGLKSGDKIITFGYSDLIDGQQVKY